MVKEKWATCLNTSGAQLNVRMNPQRQLCCIHPGMLSAQEHLTQIAKNYRLVERTNTDTDRGSGSRWDGESTLYPVSPTECSYKPQTGCTELQLGKNTRVQVPPNSQCVYPCFLYSYRRGDCSSHNSAGRPSFPIGTAVLRGWAN